MVVSFCFGLCFGRSISVSVEECIRHFSSFSHSTNFLVVEWTIRHQVDAVRSAVPPTIVFYTIGVRESRNSLSGLKLSHHLLVDAVAGSVRWQPD